MEGLGCSEVVERRAKRVPRTHCGGFICELPRIEIGDKFPLRLKPALLALGDIAVFEWRNALLPFFLLHLASELPPVIASQQCSDGRSQRGTDRCADLSSAALYQPMNKDETTQSDQTCGESIHGVILTPQIHHTE